MSEYVHQITPEETAHIERFMFLSAVSVAAFVVLTIAAIVTIDRWLVLISPASERRFIEPYVTWAHQHLLDPAEPALQAYVSGLAQQVSMEMDINKNLVLEIRVVKGDAVNAFTTLGGYIFVFEGLLLALDNENSLAMVLGHEIAHAVNRDPLLGTGRGMLLQLMLSSLSGGSVDPSTIEFGSDLMLNTYSRDQEQAADLLALTALQRQYGHVGGATQLFAVLSEYGDEPQTTDILSSHPNPGARIDYLNVMTNEKGWVERTTQPYPAAIQSILWD
jgi:predicted Zn-dependent protease